MDNTTPALAPTCGAVLAQRSNRNFVGAIESLTAPGADPDVGGGCCGWRWRRIGRTCGLIADSRSSRPSSRRSRRRCGLRSEDSRTKSIVCCVKVKYWLFYKSWPLCSILLARIGPWPPRHVPMRRSGQLGVL